LELSADPVRRHFEVNPASRKSNICDPSNLLHSAQHSGEIVAVVVCQFIPVEWRGPGHPAFEGVNRRTPEIKSARLIQELFDKFGRSALDMYARHGTSRQQKCRAQTEAKQWIGKNME
jgi:hypothetical protein